MCADSDEGVAAGGDWYGHMNAEDDVDTMVRHYTARYEAGLSSGEGPSEEVVNTSPLPRSLRSLWRGRRTMDPVQSTAFLSNGFA